MNDCTDTVETLTVQRIVIQRDRWPRLVYCRLDRVKALAERFAHHARAQETAAAILDFRARRAG